MDCHSGVYCFDGLERLLTFRWGALEKGGGRVKHLGHSKVFCFLWFGERFLTFTGGGSCPAFIWLRRMRREIDGVTGCFKVLVEEFAGLGVGSGHGVSLYRLSAE